MTMIYRLVMLLAVIGSSGCLENLSGRSLYDAGAASSDVGVDSAADTAACEPESDEQLCTAAAATCGTITVADACDKVRVVDCGGDNCVAPNTCGGGESDNECGCSLLTAAAFCSVNGNAECGTVSGTDPCGVTRSEACGECGVGDVCISNHCICKPDTDAEFCATAGATCGQVTDFDNCGEMRTADCGGCSAPDSCGADNTCSCTPEAPGVTCSRLGLNCDSASVLDNCGTMVTVNCGADCSAIGPQATCGGGGTPNVCACSSQTDGDFCIANGATCGVVTAMDLCGDTRTVNCGACSAPQTCGGGTIAAQCGCTPESNAAFCDRLSFECEAVSGTDNCGMPRMNVNCGSCTSPETCNSVAPNQCDCVPSPIAQFCSMHNAVCGSLTAVDRCGNSRTANCGGCGTAQQCASNQCVCAPELDADFCDRNNACGTVTLPDNCGAMRTVNCQSCGANEGQCVNGVCSQCTPETNTQFCNRVGSQCGSTTGTDNCGDTRTANCGSCSNGGSGSYTCQGNLCVCIGDDPQTFCPEKSCGVQDIVDNCGNVIPVNCGVCDDGQTCGPDGHCQCRVPTQAEACGDVECGWITVFVCDKFRQFDCGGCPGTQGVCVGNQCVLSGG